MAVYVKMHCKSCGKTHKFCLPKKEEFSVTENYEYVCPESGNPAVVTPGQKGKAVKRRPKDSIIVKPQPLREP